MKKEPKGTLIKQPKRKTLKKASVSLFDASSFDTLPSFIRQGTFMTGKALS